MPFAGFTDWDSCMITMREKYDEETAKKMCGKLKAKYEKDFDHDLIIEKYNKLKLEHPEFDERQLLEEVFSNISKDFIFDDKEQWVTIKGTHVLIKEGESKEEVIKKFISTKGKIRIKIKNLNKREKEIVEGIKKQKEIDERHKKSSEKRQKEKIKIKVQKIIKKEEYHTTCDECGRELKKCLVTDKGNFGYRCYLKLIGIPSRKQGLNVSDLPDQAFEGITENVIEEVEKLTPKEIIDLIIPHIDIDKLKFPIRFTSKIHIRYYKENYKGTGQGKWLGDSLFPGQGIWRLGRKLGIPNAVMRKVESSNTLNEYWREQVRITNENPLGTSIEDFSFPETMSKSIGKGKIVKGKKRKVKICDDCKKEKELYYQKLCKECYQKRVKHYIEVYDLKEDYPVNEYTREGGKVKVKAHKRGEVLSREERDEKWMLKSKEERMIDGVEYEQPTKKFGKNVLMLADVITLEDFKSGNESDEETMKALLEDLHDRYEWRKAEGQKVKFIKRKHHVEIWRTYDFQEDLLIKKPLFIFDTIGDAFQYAGDMFDSVNLSEDYPVQEYTRESGKIKVKAHTRGESEVLTDEEINELYEVIDSDDYKLFMKYSSQWTSGIDPDARSMAIYLANSNEKLKKYLQFQHFGEKIPKEVTLYRVGGIEYDEFEWSSFWTSLESAKSYQKRFGVNIIHKYKTDIKNIIPTLSGAGEVYAKDIKSIIEDLVEDAEAIPSIKSSIPSGQTRLQRLWETQKAFERATRLGKELGVQTSVSPVKSITVPFSITNTETGKTMSGEVTENLEKNTKQLIPVSSSTVRASGQFGAELLVQFHPSKLQPMRTYRYMFETPEQAGEANKSLTSSGSPGRWIWQNMRGHIGGEKVSSSKLGPSLSPPGQGLPTIGGTSSSLVPYSISNRVPVSRVKNFDEILREMKRSASNPATNPMTGSRIESLVGARKELREMQTPGWRSGTKGLPPIGDFVYIGNLNELEEDYKVSGHWRHYKSGKKAWIKEHERGEGKTQENEKVPLWRELKNKRKQIDKIANEMVELGSNFTMSIKKKREKHQELWIQLLQLRHELSEQVPEKKKNEQDLKKLEQELEYLESSFKEFGEFKDWEQRESYKEAIEVTKEDIEVTKDKIKKAEEFEKELFEDKTTIKYTFDITLHKKLKIQKGLITRYPYLAEDKINTINNAFYDLPKNLQDSCKQIRIFEKANDDPLYGALRSCGGFYNSTEEYITIGLKSYRKDVFGHSVKFLKEATIHEAAHAIHLTHILSIDEMYDADLFYSKNKKKLENRGEYAATNTLEFFAEGYTKLYIGDHHWFMGLKKGTKGFFQDIMKKYDFILDFLMKDLNDEINGIKFSYQDGNNHIFGFYQILKDISQDEAQKMVDDGKAQFENVDKYIEKEVLKKE